MGSVTIRNLDDAVKRSARLVAARNGRSLEAELRALLEQTYGDATAERVRRIQAMPGEDWVSELIAIAGGADLQIPERWDVLDDRREIFGAD